MIDGRFADMTEACRIVVIHRPTAVADNIVKFPAALHIVLRQNVRTDVSAAFTLARQKADPFKLPVVCIVISAVFDVIPNAESHL